LATIATIEQLLEKFWLISNYLLSKCLMPFLSANILKCVTNSIDDFCSDTASGQLGQIAFSKIKLFHTVNKNLGKFGTIKLV
jgi:hypothetical protein